MNTQTVPNVRVIPTDDSDDRHDVLVEGVGRVAQDLDAEVAEQRATEVRAKLAREAVIDGLRALADFLEQTPEAPTPNLNLAYVMSHTWPLDAGRDEFLAAAKTVGGEVRIDGHEVEVRRKFGPVTYEVSMHADRVLESRKVEREEFVLPPELEAMTAAEESAEL